MTDLIARLEAATEGSRELDMDISRSLNHIGGRCPHHTTSIDSALTLVPAKSLWSVADMEDGPVAQVLIPLLGGHFGEGGSSHGATPALALCIAALRARQSETAPGSE